MATVVLQGVSKVFPGSIRAVTQLHLRVDAQRFVVLVGPSGCGKTTTLRLIAGLEQATEGTIRIGEQLVNHLPPRRRNLAMVGQDAALYPHLSVRANMAFGLRMRQRKWFAGRHWARVVDRQVGRTARMLGIDQLLDRMPDQLSGGQQQRVALGRAIVRRPAAFLFDEPLSGLDERYRSEMRRLLKQLFRRLGTAVVYVTHDRVEAMSLADQIVVMNDGRAQQTGPPLDVYARPRNLMVAEFLSDPQLNCFHGRWEGKTDTLRFVGNGLNLAIPASAASRLRWAATREVVLGVRPQDMAIAGPTELADATGRAVDCQRLGNRTVLDLEWDDQAARSHGQLGQRAVMEVPTGLPWVYGTVVRIRLDRTRLLWFDRQTGDSLTEH